MTNLSGNKGLKSAKPRSGTSTKPQARDRARPPARASGAIDNVSASLRQAYQSTLEEDVPDSIMDLLRKLD